MIQTTKKAVKKIVLDKLPDQWYNIHNDGREGYTPIDTLIELHSINEELSLLNREIILSRIKVVNDAFSKDVFKDSGMNIVVAGGCIRDMIYGLQVKDVDFFVDLGPEFSDEQVDFFDLLCYEIKNADTVEDCYVNQNYAIDREKGKGFENFEVKNFMFEDERADAQLIGGFYGLENPLDITEKFDYNLVEGAMNISTGEIRLSSRFTQGLEKKVIHVNKSSGFERSNRWHSRARGLLPQFTIIHDPSITLTPKQGTAKVVKRKGPIYFGDIPVYEVDNLDVLADNNVRFEDVRALWDQPRNVRVIDI